MKNILIGNTGLVGQTLKEKVNFDYEYNSKNILEYSVDDNCNLWLSCLPATKWLVNKNPKNDLDNIIFIIDIIKKFKYNKIYLISTIDVYGDSPLVVDENFEPIFKNFNYGSNRLLFEKMVKNFLTYNSLKIYRLPALFNNKIKKNILFDLLNDNNISSINSNSFFQWFNLDELHDFMIKYDNEERLLFNLFTEPINTKEIIELFSEYKDKVGNGDYIIYNWQTNLTPSKYLYSKEEMLDKIKIFINEYRG